MTYFSIHVNNAFIYKDKVGIVASLLSCIVEQGSRIYFGLARCGTH